MEDDVAAGAGVDEGGEVGDVTVGELEGSRVRIGRGWKGCEIARAAHERPNGVALGEQSAAEGAAKVTGCAGHQRLHLCTFSLFEALTQTFGLWTLDGQCGFLVD